MGDDARAEIGAKHRTTPTPAPTSAIPIHVDEFHEATPPPRAIDPAMQEIIDRFWPLRHIDRQHADERMRDQDRVIKLATDVARIEERLDGVTKFGDALGELSKVKADHEQLRREVWGEEPRKLDEPSLARQARSGRRLLAIILAVATTFGAAAAGGILMSIRKNAEAEGEERAWRAQVNAQIQMLLSVVFRVDMRPAAPHPVTAEPPPAKD